MEKVFIEINMGIIMKDTGIWEKNGKFEVIFKTQEKLMIAFKMINLIEKANCF